MGWTDCTDLVAGQLVTDSHWNNLLGATGSLQFLYEADAVRVKNSSDQTVADGATLALAFNQEDFDTNALHDVSSNNSRLTCVTAGVYLITGNVTWDEVEPTAADTAYLQTWIRLGGATAIATVRQFPTIDTSFAQCVTTIYELAVSNYVELCVKPFYIEEANGNVDLSSRFDMCWLRGPTV